MVKFNGLKKDQVRFIYSNTKRRAIHYVNKNKISKKEKEDKYQQTYHIEIQSNI